MKKEKKRNYFCIFVVVPYIFVSGVLKCCSSCSRQLQLQAIFDFKYDDKAPSIIKKRKRKLQLTVRVSLFPVCFGHVMADC
ncbi:hypothetical protein CICLE_v10013236mg [Citrus x clementina]|uniref:Uncharacterized protein n=1 Tax=Citrus clementina TaxID=85681 RepID=V4SRS8_CITCL|nr:hypothetical protein CICLE_v10013236mg [Citrus x clementina]